MADINEGFFGEISDDQLLVNMSMHPTPLEEKDPLALDIIKQEHIKEETDKGYCDYIVDDSGIRIKEEVDVSDEIDEYQQMPTLTLNIDCEGNETQDTDWKQSASEDIAELLTAENYKCDMCNEKFSHKLEIQTHLKSIHSIYDRIEDFGRFTIDLVEEGSTSVTRNNNSYNCSYCEKSFSRGYYVKTHERIHTGLKPYKCSFCEKLFSRPDYLKKHERIHTGIKPYTCNFCEKSFSRPDCVTKHERIHEGIKPYNCSFCGKSFSQADNLRKHERIHTGIKPYKCSFCEKSFSRADYVTTHEIFHTGIKPYNCSFCKKTFSQPTNLKIHERIHTGIKPYNCSFCEKSFSRSSSLKIHERTHKRIKPL